MRSLGPLEPFADMALIAVGAPVTSGQIIEGIDEFNDDERDELTPEERRALEAARRKKRT